MIDDTRFLFIVMSKTYSFFGRTIRFFSRYRYNHVSISLEEELAPLYSFARYHYNASLFGGFVEESWLRYLYNNDNIPISVYAIPINDEQYMEIKECLAHMGKKGYRYDMIGAITRKRRSTSLYTCLSFTERILKDIGVIHKTENISTLRRLEAVMSKYYIEDQVILAKAKNRYAWGNDEYFKKKERKPMSLVRNLLGKIIKL